MFVLAEKKINNVKFKKRDRDKVTLSISRFLSKYTLFRLPIMKSSIFLFLIVLCTVSCASKKVHFTLVQANDVYEIAPINGGVHGGLARVQTIVKQLKEKNKHTYTLLAGDFLSPSAIGTAKVEGKRLNGKQMVDTLNAMNWDYVTLGNHEFDNGKDILIERLSEARFKTITSNLKDGSTKKTFNNTVTTDVIDIDGVKVGFAGLILPMPTKTYLDILDPLLAAQLAIEELNQKGADILVFITHQNIEEDIELAKAYPAIDIIMGGHEHENIYMRRGESLTTIAKADANARSLYIHSLTFNKKSKSLTIDSKLRSINQQIAQDPETKAVVDRWVNRSMSAFKDNGFNPDKVIAKSTKMMDGLEANIRNQSTLLTQLVETSAINAFEDADLSLINVGCIRIDDTITPGPISEYDVIRILPFGGNYELFSIPGDILENALNIGLTNQGTGAFLIHANTKKKNGHWYIGDTKLDHNRSYRAVSPSYLMTVGDKNLKFLTTNKRIKKISTSPVNVRTALISELASAFPE